MTVEYLYLERAHCYLRCWHRASWYSQGSLEGLGSTDSVDSCVDALGGRGEVRLRLVSYSMYSDIEAKRTKKSRASIALCLRLVQFRALSGAFQDPSFAYHSSPIKPSAL